MSDIADFLDSYVPPDASAMVSSPNEISLFPPNSFAPQITPLTTIEPSGAGFLTDIGSLVHSATQPIVQYYGDQAAIARAKGQTAIVNAQTANAVKVAGAGQPSPYFLIAAGVGILALVLVAKK